MKLIFSRQVIVSCVLLLQLLSALPRNKVEAVAAQTSPKVVLVSIDARQQVAAGSKQIEEFLLSGNANETGLGVHGHIAAHRQIQAVFFAYGPNVPTRLTGTINSIDVVPKSLPCLASSRHAKLRAKRSSIQSAKTEPKDNSDSSPSKRVQASLRSYKTPCFLQWSIKD